MGHERVSSLPKTQRWRDIVNALGDFHEQGSVGDIARQTTENVRSRFRILADDAGVQSAFEFLVALAVSSRSDNPRQDLLEFGIDFPENATPLIAAREIRDWIARNPGSAEYARLAELAAADTIGHWCRENHSEPNLFGDEPEAYAPWRAASNGAGFCELSRLFFAKVTERYLNYFLEREASASIPSIRERDRFQRELEEHIEKVSKHAFETAQITQSFAAGWFNKNAKEGVPSDEQIRNFLSVVFGKLNEELRREGVQE